MRSGLCRGENNAVIDFPDHRGLRCTRAGVGIEARTDNAKESTPDGIIPKQWQRFFNEGIPSKIPDATGPVFYAVYSDYAGDHNGEYYYLVGQRVKAGSAAPGGMVARQVLAGEY